MLSTDNVQAAVKLILSGNVDVWEQGYYDLLFNKTMSEKLQGIELLSYEYERRDILYRAVHEKMIGNKPIDYLEFGVFQGDSMRKWTSINTHPNSRFFGFDSFEGLPENWAAGQRQKGAFTTNGVMPSIDDPRVTFVKGWFNQSLVPFLQNYKPENQLVLHMDADLFSSTLFVLMTLNPLIKRGTVVVFDDFNSRDDFAALLHFSKSCGHDWTVLAARDNIGKLGIVIH